MFPTSIIVLFETHQGIKGHFFNELRVSFKVTLMQIWKSPYMFVFIWKQYLENFAFLILIILELFPRKVCKFLKK